MITPGCRVENGSSCVRAFSHPNFQSLQLPVFCVRTFGTVTANNHTLTQSQCLEQWHRVWTAVVDEKIRYTKLNRTHFRIWDEQRCVTTTTTTTITRTIICFWHLLAHQNNYKIHPKPIFNWDDNVDYSSSALCVTVIFKYCDNSVRIEWISIKITSANVEQWIKVVWLVGNLQRFKRIGPAN